MDNRSKEARSRNMSRIPSKNTKPEETLPGCPDIVLPKYKTVVFVNGCFWHAHQGCKWFVPPKSNSEFWQHKFMYNIERDERNYQKLCDLGWRVIIVWECEIRHGDASLRLAHLVSEIKEV